MFHTLAFSSELHSFCCHFHLAWRMFFSIPCNAVLQAMKSHGFFTFKCFILSLVLKDSFHWTEISEWLFSSFFILKIWFICVGFALFGFFGLHFSDEKSTSHHSYHFFPLSYILFFSAQFHDLLFIFWFQHFAYNVSRFDLLIIYFLGSLRFWRSHHIWKDFGHYFLKITFCPTLFSPKTPITHMLEYLILAREPWRLWSLSFSCFLSLFWLDNFCYYIIKFTNFLLAIYTLLLNTTSVFSPLLSRFTILEFPSRYST